MPKQYERNAVESPSLTDLSHVGFNEPELLIVHISLYIVGTFMSGVVQQNQPRARLTHMHIAWHGHKVRYGLVIKDAW